MNHLAGKMEKKELGCGLNCVSQKLMGTSQACKDDRSQALILPEKKDKLLKKLKHLPASKNVNCEGEEEEEEAEGRVQGRKGSTAEAFCAGCKQKMMLKEPPKIQSAVSRTKSKLFQELIGNNSEDSSAESINSEELSTSTFEDNC